MPRGPLPRDGSQRRNAPTIPTTSLPAGGFRGETPRVPTGYKLGRAGRAWWRWAWRQPQAAAWDTGSHYGLARRAQLEDDLVALELVDDLDLVAVLNAGDDDELRRTIRKLEFAIARLRSLAAGELAVMKEARELDRRYGLDPKALAELRWKIVSEGDADDAKPRAKSPKVRRLHAVDPAAAAAG
jgi:hypothetical protein